jgi:hypothetical protein
MAIKVVKVVPKPKRGHPATAKDPLIALRVPAATIAEIDKWGGDRVSRSEAIRRLNRAKYQPASTILLLASMYFPAYWLLDATCMSLYWVARLPKG